MANFYIPSHRFVICESKMSDSRQASFIYNQFFLQDFATLRQLIGQYLTTTTRIHFGFALLFKFVNPAED